MPVPFQELSSAFDFVNSEPAGANSAFMARDSGTIYYQSIYGDPIDEIPDDIDDDEKYIRVPTSRDLDVDRSLAFDFVRATHPTDYDDVRDMFQRKGAYRRFKDYLMRKGTLKNWYDFQLKAQESALRAWCAENEIDVTD